MHFADETKRDICSLCLAKYSTTALSRTKRFLYETFIFCSSSAACIPIAIFLGEFLPKLPKRNSNFDVFGLDLRQWRSDVFDLLLSEDALNDINKVFLKGSEPAVKYCYNVNRFSPLIIFGLSKLGALGKKEFAKRKKSLT